jgi:catechol 2,3-dioxygenase
MLHPGAVQLTVADLNGVQAFYERAIGLRALERTGDTVALGAEPGRRLIELVGQPDAAQAPPRASGLFHTAILVPDRRELARALRRVAEARVPFTGASDHLVSEALYLNDPEGNGIELYRDRPREQWQFIDGELQMGTFALDVDDLLSALPEGGPDPGMPPGTRVGHVHLKVADLAEAEAFYCDDLGFEVMARAPGALFVATGGYHHHVGLNVWSSAGVPAPGPDTLGLRAVELVDPGGEARELIDPSGNVVRLVPQERSVEASASR